MKKKGAYEEKVCVPSADEIEKAEHYLVKYGQRGLIMDDKSSRKLTPFADERGIQRISGRINKSPLFNYNRSHPMILTHENKTNIHYFISYFGLSYWLDVVWNAFRPRH